MSKETLVCYPVRAVPSETDELRERFKEMTSRPRYEVTFSARLSKEAAQGFTEWRRQMIDVAVRRLWLASEWHR